MRARPWVRIDCTDCDGRGHRDGLRCNSCLGMGRRNVEVAELVAWLRAEAIAAGMAPDRPPANGEQGSLF